MARINDAMALKTVFSSDFPLLVEGALHVRFFLFYISILLFLSSFIYVYKPNSIIQAIGSICASFILHPWLGVVTACAAFTVFVSTLVFGFIGNSYDSFKKI